MENSTIDRKYSEYRREAWSSGWGQKAHVQEVVGLNPAIYWMDVSDASYYILIEKGNKGSQMGHTKKYENKNSEKNHQ